MAKDKSKNKDSDKKKMPKVDAVEKNKRRSQIDKYLNAATGNRKKDKKNK